MVKLQIKIRLGLLICLLCFVSVQSAADLTSGLSELTRALNNLAQQINKTTSTGPTQKDQYFPQIIPKDIQGLIVELLSQAKTHKEGVSSIGNFLAISMKNYNPNDVDQAANIISMIKGYYKEKITEEEIARHLETPGARQWLLRKVQQSDPVLLKDLRDNPIFYIPATAIEKDKKYQIKLKEGQEVLIELQEKDFLPQRGLITSKNPQHLKMLKHKKISSQEPTPGAPDYSFYVFKALKKGTADLNIKDIIVGEKSDVVYKVIIE